MTSFSIKRMVETSPRLLSLKYKFLHALHWLDYLRRGDRHEKELAKSGNVFEDCNDWKLLEKCVEAGEIRGGYLYMHNGIRVLPTAYNGYAHSLIIRRARGVHEPQEERLFRDVLPHVASGTTMIELGAFWSFYSIWFLKDVKNGEAICVEPELSHLNYGEHHMKVNGVAAKFFQAYIGREVSTGGRPETLTVDEIVKRNSVRRVGVLHADIQGFESDMLDGTQRSFGDGLVDYAFISTHSAELHDACRRKLVSYGMRVIADVPLAESWNPDGVIVAQRENLTPIPLEPPHLKHGS